VGDGPKQRDGIAAAERADHHVVHRLGVLHGDEQLRLRPARHRVAELGDGAVAVGEESGAEPVVDPGARDHVRSLRR